MLQVTAAESARAFFEGLDSMGERAGVTVLLLAAAAAVGWLLLPRLVENLRDSVVQWAVGGAALRLVQSALFVGVTVAVLFTWEYGAVVDETVVYFQSQELLVGRLLGSIALFLLAYVGTRVIADSVDNLGRQTDWITEHQEEIVLRVSQLGFFVTIGLGLLTVWGISLNGLLVGAGFLGIVVGFAARQTLGSLLAGFVLMFSRPFTIGDWVRIGDQEGIVTDITIFNTRLENFDGEFVVMPNDKVSNQAITNRSQKGLLRLRVDVGIDYTNDPDRAKRVALDAISDCPEVVNAPPPQVFPKNFGDSAVVMEMRFWIDHPTPPRKWKAVSAVVTSVKSAFEEEGVEIPFPQRELSGRGGGFDVKGVDGAAESAGEAVEAREQD
jgi:small-conductance mechanosensitive channel